MPVVATDTHVDLTCMSMSGRSDIPLNRYVHACVHVYVNPDMDIPVNVHVHVHVNPDADIPVNVSVHVRTWTRTYHTTYVSVSTLTHALMGWTGDRAFAWPIHPEAAA